MYTKAVFTFFNVPRGYNKSAPDAGPKMPP